MKQKRQQQLLAWRPMQVATVRSMDDRRWNRDRMATLLAAGVLLAVVGYWSLQLLPPSPAPTNGAPAAAATPVAAVDAKAAEPLVRLLSPGAIRTEVVVLGVLAGTQAPLALLSLDGGPAEAYAPGQRLGPSTVLAAVHADAVEVDQAGSLRSLPVPALPPLPVDGIVPAGGRQP